MKSFNVIEYDFNRKKFVPYNVIPYFLRCYWDRVKHYDEQIEIAKSDAEHYQEIMDSLQSKYYKIPKSFSEFREFVELEGRYQFWGRCEYETILGPWPYILSPSETYNKEGENDINAWKEHWKKHLESCDKWDVWDQIKMNLDIVTQIVMDTIKNESTEY